MSIYVILIISLFFSAFFSGMEIAFISANKLKLELDKQSNKYFSKLLSKALHSPSRFIASMLVGNNIALVIYGITMAEFLDPILSSYTDSSFLILLLQTVFSTLIILITAEFFPKAIFRINPNLFLRLFAVPLVFFYHLLSPIVTITLFLSKKGLKFIGIVLVEDNPVFGKVDLEEYLEQFSSPSEGEEVEMEVQILQNALDFSNVKVRECMVPRTEIVAISISKSIQELKDVFIDTKLSKVLIFQDSIDQIIGYSHSSELFKEPSDIKSILYPIPFVPESMHANELLELFISQSKTIAVVVDEFGGTSGMITIEDVMEEIFGEIEDEFDVEQEFEHMIDENHYVFSGRLELDYLNEKYKFNLEVSEEYETLAGFLISKLENIPKKGAVIVVGKYKFIVDIVTDIKIDRVSLQKR
jgi:putative hemolysin